MPLQRRSARAATPRSCRPLYIAVDRRRAKREAYAIAASELQSFLQVGAHIQLADDPDDHRELDRIEAAFKEVIDSLRFRCKS